MWPTQMSVACEPVAQPISWADGILKKGFQVLSSPLLGS